MATATYHTITISSGTRHTAATYRTITAPSYVLICIIVPVEDGGFLGDVPESVYVLFYATNGSIGRAVVKDSKKDVVVILSQYTLYLGR